MKLIYFDICSIPVYLLILWTCYARRMTKGRANTIFIIMNWVSLICAVADITMEFVVNPVPLTETRVALGMLISFTYKLFRNSGFAIYLLYIFSITRTEHLLRPAKNRWLFWTPMGIVFIALIQNFFTRNVFSVTVEAGYSREPLLWVFYAVALLYGLAGTAYAIYCKRYMTRPKWVAILSVYALTYVSVIVELVRPQYLVEMFATSIGVAMIMLLVKRPEESMDGALGLQNWQAYKTDLGNILKSHEKVQILVIQISNALEIRTFLGEDRYNGILQEVADELSKVYTYRNSFINKEIYIQRPGTLYYILNDWEYDLEARIPPFLRNAKERTGSISSNGIHCDTRVCLIRYPDDLSGLDDILSLGQKFAGLGKIDQTVFFASQIVNSHDYEILHHMDEILNRALSGNGFEIYYQPIYNNRTGRFESAEALLRLNDSKYGSIPPSVFIPVAETNGLIIPIGRTVLDMVFSFIANYDLKALGLSHIEINLSVAQILQQDLPKTVKRLQEKYRINPEQVNFEITETLYDNLSDTMNLNINTLKEMGYSFSLDDYGIGYSNIQRMSKLPLKMIKIDKSLVDEMFTEDGQAIIQNTIRMVQGIHKQLVIEGVETEESIRVLSEMACDYIQGYYYSKPLPQNQFIQFLMDNMRSNGQEKNETIPV